MDGDSRLPAGCVAIAMAQIMKYYNFPEQGIGQRETYETTNGITVPEVDFEIAYDWEDMLNAYPNANSGTEAERNAVATLIYHAGAALKMNYNANGSEPIALTANSFIT